MDKRDTYALRRLCLKAAVLAALALARVPSSFRDNAGLLFAFAALFDAAIAIVRSERVTGRNFTYWDEAAVFALMATVLMLV